MHLERPLMFGMSYFGTYTYSLCSNVAVNDIEIGFLLGLVGLG